MKNNFITNFFFKGIELESKTVKQRAQLPTAIFGNLVFLVGYLLIFIAEIFRGTYTVALCSGLALFMFILSCFLLRKDKIEIAMTLDTFGILLGVVGIVFFLYEGNSVYEVYRSVAFLAVMGIFNQFYAYTKKQLLIFFYVSSFIWILAVFFLYRNLLNVDFTEAIIAIVVGTIAFLSSNFGILLLNKQNEIVSTDAIQQGKNASETLAYLKDIIAKSSEGLEIGNVLNMHVNTVTNNINDIDSLYSYLKDESENLTSKSRIMLDTSSTLSTDVKQMQDSVLSQNERLVFISESLSQITNNIINVSGIAEDKRNSMKDLIGNLDLQLSLINKLVDLVKKIQESSISISNFVTTVNKISTQTGLLAMNASIEAAHAGEAGKGFQVIAHEIRKLSDETSKNALLIDNSLKENTEIVNSAIEAANNCVTYSENNNKVLSDSIEAIENLLAVVMDVANKSKEASKSLSELAKDADKSNEYVDNSVEQIEVQNKMVGEISDFSKNLESRVTALYDLLEDIKEAITNIHDAAIKNSESTKQIASSLHE